MYYCKHIKKADKVAWENLVGTNPAGGFHQSFNWSVFMRLEDWDSYKIGLFSDNKLIGGAMILQFHFNDGTNFLYIPEGPILDYGDDEKLLWQWRALETAIRSIVDVAEGSTTTHLRIEPRISQCPSWFLRDFEKAPLNLQPKYTQIVRLDQSAEDILVGMKQKGRYNIKLAERKGVAVEMADLNPANMRKFYALYAETFKRNTFDGKPLSYFESFVKAYGREAKFFMAHHEGDLLAAAIVVYFGERATYLYGASTDHKREFMAPYALHWEIIKSAKNEKFKEYDLWGIHNSVEDKDHAWHGITRFKKQFSDTSLNLVGAYDYIFQKDLYEEFLKKHEI